MSVEFLLDTNILSNLIRQPQGIVYDHIRRVGEHRICTSVIVAAELRYGSAKKGVMRLTDRVDAILGAIEVVPLDRPADKTYGRVRAELERQGNLIGPNDLLIAAQTVALDLTLVTDNTGEFARIAELKLVNWLREN